MSCNEEFRARGVKIVGPEGCGDRFGVSQSGWGGAFVDAVEEHFCGRTGSYGYSGGV